MAIIKIKFPQSDSTKTETTEQRYAKFFAEISQDDLNIQDVRDFYFEWKCALEAIINQAELHQFLTNYEFNIEERLKVYWGEAAYIMPDRMTRKIICAHPDGRRYTIV